MVVGQRLLGLYPLPTYFLPGVPGQKEGHIHHQIVGSAIGNMPCGLPRLPVRTSIFPRDVMAEVSCGL